VYGRNIDQSLADHTEITFLAKEQYPKAKIGLYINIFIDETLRLLNSMHPDKWSLDALKEYIIQMIDLFGEFFSSTQATAKFCWTFYEYYYELNVALPPTTPTPTPTIVTVEVTHQITTTLTTVIVEKITTTIEKSITTTVSVPKVSEIRITETIMKTETITKPTTTTVTQQTTKTMFTTVTQETTIIQTSVKTNIVTSTATYPTTTTLVEQNWAATIGIGIVVVVIGVILGYFIKRR